jgi:putative Holliday junction resolvase
MTAIGEEHANASPAVTVLGFDFGTQRIGVAVGNTLTASARPLAVLPTRDGAPDWAAIARLVQEWQPQQLVVGLPLNMDGSDSQTTINARSFSRKLAGRLRLPVALVDERLTTRTVRDDIHHGSASGTRKGKAAEAIDALAAALILEQWLAQREAG